MDTYGSPRVAAIITGCLVFAASYWIFGVESDAAYAINDALTNAAACELTPWRDINAHHILFHLGANGLTVCLEAVGIDRPGHHAVKTMSALGAALVAALTVLAAGRRWWAGLLLLAPLAATRGFWIEAGTGENVLLGAAGAVLATAMAFDPTKRARLVGAAVVFALLCRQDNLLLVPAWTWVLGRRLPAAGRAMALGRWLGVTGGVTLAAFAATWPCCDPGTPFRTWMLHTSAMQPEGHWSVTGGSMGSESWRLHLGALSILVVGFITEDTTANLAVALGFLAALGTMGVVLRGDQRTSGVLPFLGLVLLFRAPFYVWFEPQNFEWWIVPVCVACWCMASLTRGAERLSRFRLATGAAVCVVATASVVFGHGEHTWDLRDRSLSRLMDRAVAAGSVYQEQLWVPLSHRPRVGFRVRGLPTRNSAVNMSLEAKIQHLGQLSAQNPGAAIVAVEDRFVHDGSLLTDEAQQPRWAVADRFVALPGTRYLRRKGRIEAIIIAPRR